MYIAYGAEAQKRQNSQACCVREYSMEEKEINGALVCLNGRYPDKGFVTNLLCKELAYVISGAGKLVVEGKETFLSTGDLALVLPKEKYFWEGKMTLFISSTPAWNPDQHQLLSDSYDHMPKDHCWHLDPK